MAATAPIDRFREKYVVDPDSGCWIWQAFLNRKGYGEFYDGQTGMVRAHRWSYEHFVGPIPDGLYIDHLCRVPRCVNPAHLECVTPRENALRGFGPTALNARKTHCKRGHPLAGDNLYRKKGAGRICRTCQRAYFVEFHRKKREAAA